MLCISRSVQPCCFSFSNKGIFHQVKQNTFCELMRQGRRTLLPVEALRRTELPMKYLEAFSKIVDWEESVKPSVVFHSLYRLGSSRGALVMMPNLCLLCCCSLHGASIACSLWNLVSLMLDPLPEAIMSWPLDNRIWSDYSKSTENTLDCVCIWLLVNSEMKILWMLRYWRICWSPVPQGWDTIVSLSYHQEWEHATLS